MTPSKPVISLIVAMDENRLIGRDGDLPWRLPGDLAHFKRTTLGHPILMGRRTWESLGRPLPGRHNIVLTRDANYSAEGAEVVHDLDDALAPKDLGDEVFVIGGAQLYALTLPLAQRLIVTHVRSTFDGDTWFPEIDWSEWKAVEREHRVADERNAYDHDFITYVRKD